MFKVSALQKSGQNTGALLRLFFHSFLANMCGVILMSYANCSVSSVLNLYSPSEITITVSF